VVADLYFEDTVAAAEADFHLIRPGVLESVGQPLGDAEPSRVLDRRREPRSAQRRAGPDHHGHRQPASLGLDGLEQTTIAQHRWPDRVRQVP
jgi:hypothetical protein